MKRIMAGALLIIGFSFAVFYQEGESSKRTLVFPTDRKKYPTLFLPEKNVQTLLKKIVEARGGEIYDTKKFFFYHLDLKTVTAKKRSYKLLLKRIESTLDDAEQKLTGKQLDGAIQESYAAHQIFSKTIDITQQSGKIEITTTNIADQKLLLYENFFTEAMSFGVITGNDSFLIRSTYAVTFSPQGIIASPSTDQTRVASLVKHFNGEGQYQTNGVIVAFPYSYLNEYFILNPAIIGRERYELRNIVFSDDSDGKRISVDFNIIIRSPINLTIKTGYLARKQDNVITALKPLKYTFSVASKPIADKIAADIKKYFNERALNRSVDVNLTSSKFYIGQRASFSTLSIDQNASVSYFQDNVLVRILN